MLVLYLLISLLISGCFAQTTSESNLPVDGENSSLLASQNVALHKAELEGCMLSVDEGYLWRDWQPTVSSPGPDGGSPLYVSVVVSFANSADLEQNNIWRGDIQDFEKYLYPISLIVRDEGLKTTTKVLSESELKLILIAHDGPYLNIASSARLLVQFSGGGGGKVLIATDWLTINRIL